MTTQPDLSAPAHDAGADGLPWWRRGLAQGAGYFLPSGAFVLVPFLFSEGWTPRTWALAILAAVALLVFFLGTTVVLHWSETRRWLWFAGLLGAIAVLGWVTDGDARPAYFAAFATASAAVLIAWRHARIVIPALSLLALGWSLVRVDTFGVVMGMMAFGIGWGIGSSIDAERTKVALRRAEERTAVLAVAAERERIGRDLGPEAVLAISLSGRGDKDMDTAARWFELYDEGAQP